MTPASARSAQIITHNQEGVHAEIVTEGLLCREETQLSIQRTSQ